MPYRLLQGFEKLCGCQIARKIRGNAGPETSALACAGRLGSPDIGFAHSGSHEVYKGGLDAIPHIFVCSTEDAREFSQVYRSDKLGAGHDLKELLRLCCKIL